MKGGVGDRRGNGKGREWELEFVCEMRRKSRERQLKLKDLSGVKLNLANY